MQDGDLKLRPVVVGDRDVYVAWLTDPTLGAWHGFRDPEAEFDRVLRSKYNFLVEVTGRVVGCIAVESNWARGVAGELGVMIAREERRRGFGSRAVALALDFAFRETGLHRVWHGVVSDQVGVMAFLRGVGLVEEGRAREARLGDGVWLDHVYFSVLEGEWLARRAGSAVAV